MASAGMMGVPNWELSVTKRLGVTQAPALNASANTRYPPGKIDVQKSPSMVRVRAQQKRTCPAWKSSAFRLFGSSGLKIV